jgi:hypothetical protein
MVFSEKVVYPICQWSCSIFSIKIVISGYPIFSKPIPSHGLRDIPMHKKIENCNPTKTAIFLGRGLGGPISGGGSPIYGWFMDGLWMVWNRKPNLYG